MSENWNGNNPQNGYPYQTPQNGYPYQAPQNDYPYQTPQNNYPNQAPQNNYSYQAPQNNYTNPVPQGDMPSKGLYLFLVIIGFLCGIIWGALSIGPYNKMKEAIAANDSVEAKANAKKIRIFVIIGIVLNVLLLIGGYAQGQ